MYSGFLGESQPRLAFRATNLQDVTVLTTYTQRTVALAFLLSLAIPCFANSTLEFYVAPTGSDSNPGTKSKPFATLAHARDVVRQNKKPDANITVYLRGGTHRLTETLILGLGDSAPAGGSITYAAYSRETPIISSGVPLREWQKLKEEPAHLPAAARGKIWVIDVPAELGIVRTLYQGLTRLPRARTAGFTPVNYTSPASKDNQFQFPPGKIKNWPDLKDAELVVLPTRDYELNILPFASVDETTSTATTALNPTRGIGKVKYFDESVWVENILEALDQPGEWVFSAVQRKIYYWPKGRRPGKDIVAPKLTELIKIEGQIDYDGRQDKTVTGLTFRGLTFAHAERLPWHGQTGWSLQHSWEMFDRPTAAVRLRGAAQCTFQACRFTATSGTGIRLDLTCEKNRIIDNEFSHVGGCAILLAGYGPGTKDVNHHNEVVNNWVHHTGEIYWATPAIMVWQSGNNRVANNLIHNTPYTGIAVSGRISFENERQYGDGARTVRWSEVGPLEREYSWNNWDYFEKYFHGRENIVERNHIHNIMETMGDGNGIYISGTGRSNYIHQNYIHDCTGPHMGAGIRCDDFQNETVIEGNIIHHILSVQVGVSMTGKNHFINNIISDVLPSPRPLKPENIVHGYICVPSLYPYGTNDAQLDITGARIERNIVYSPRKDYLPILEHKSFSTGPGDRLKGTLTDRNIYWCSTDPKWADQYLANQRALGVEKQSLAADPLFMDIKSGDLRLRADSPAWKLGFQPIDISAIGLLPNHPYAKGKR